MKIVLMAIIVLTPIISNAGDWLPPACGTGYQYRTPQDDLDDAIKSHDISKVQAALKIKGVKTNYDYYTDYKSNCAPPIFVAISEGQADILNLLIQNGADVNSIMHMSKGFRTPLMWAAIDGQTAIVKEILKYPQIRINQIADNLYEETALFLAVINERYEAALLIANRPEVNVNIMAYRYSSPTPLLMLISNAFCNSAFQLCPRPKIDLNLAAILAKKSGSFINSDIPLTRPIRDAVWSKNDDLVDALLTSKELDVFTAGKSGSSGLDEAIWVDNAYAVQKIISRPELPANLIEKYVTNYPEVSGLSTHKISLAFAALFESPSLDPNAIDSNGKSLLERYADQPQYVLPLLKNPKVNVNIHNGGPLRSARSAYALKKCEKWPLDDQCKVIDSYISELKKMGAY